MTKTKTRKPATKKTSTTGSTVVQALEALYAKIATTHPDLPEHVVIVVGSGIVNRRLPAWGHFAPNLWTEAKAKDPQAVPEIFLAGERLDCGPLEVLETMLHESAHYLAAVRGIKDTSRRGQYHNGEFRKLAVEVGLDVPETPHKVYGFTETSIPGRGSKAGKALRANYRTELAALAKAIKATISIPELAKGSKTAKDAKTAAEDKAQAGAEPTRTNPKIVCACDPVRILRMSKTAFEAAPITCGACGEAFAYAEV